MKYCLIDIDKLRNLKCKKNNVFYRKNSNGLEQYFEYNDNERLIYYRDSNGNEEWYEYDKRGNEILFS